MPDAFRRWVVAAGLYNLASSLALTVPGLAGSTYAVVNRLNGALKLPGGPAQLPGDGLTRLFVNTAGLVLCLVGGLLIYASRDLEHRWGIPFGNAVARIVFAALVIHYAHTSDLPWAVIGMAAADIVFASVFFYYVGRRSVPTVTVPTTAVMADQTRG